MESKTRTKATAIFEGTNGRTRNYLKSTWKTKGLLDHYRDLLWGFLSLIGCNLHSFLSLPLPHLFKMLLHIIRPITISEGVRKLDLIGLVAFMFFFELFISLWFFTISFYVSLTNLFSIILFLICWLPKTLKTKEKPDSILLIQDKSRNHFTT